MRFMYLQAELDVILDPLHFGGGHSYEALAVGTPIVTLPGDYFRSRITQALLTESEVTTGARKRSRPDCSGPTRRSGIDLIRQVGGTLSSGAVTLNTVESQLNEV